MTTGPVTTAPSAPDSLLEALAKDANFVNAKDGIEAFGLYVEIVCFYKPSRQFTAHIRAFVFQNSIAVYERSRGKKAGRWTVEYKSSHDDARNALLHLIDSLHSGAFHAEVRGEPLLIQATVADVVAVSNREKHGPDCRWRGIGVIDARHGKVTDELKPTTLPEAAV